MTTSNIQTDECSSVGAFPLLEVFQHPHPGAGVFDVVVALYPSKGYGLHVSLSSYEYSDDKTEYRVVAEWRYPRLEYSKETTIKRTVDIEAVSTSLEEAARICADILAYAGITL